MGHNQGSGQGKTRGKVASLGIEAATNQACASISLTSKMSSKYVFHFLASRYNDIRGLSNAGSQDNLNGNIVKSLLIPVPPALAEQEAIAEALGDADALIESLEQLVVKKQLVKQAAMQELLTGKSRLPGFVTSSGFQESAIGSIPSDWKLNSIGPLCIKIGSGITPHGGDSNYLKSGRPFVRSQNVGWGALKTEELVFIDERTHLSFSSTELVEGDVLLNITGASIGRCALANEFVVGGNVNQHVCIIRVHVDCLIPLYLKNVLLSRIGQKQIDSFQAGGNREGLNFGQIRSMLLPVPAQLTEQTAISEVLSDMDAEIEALEARLAKARLIKHGMMQELLTGKIRLV